MNSAVSVQEFRSESRVAWRRTGSTLALAILLSSWVTGLAYASPYTWKGTSEPDAPDQWHSTSNWLLDGSPDPLDLPGPSDTVIVTALRKSTSSWTSPTNRAFASGEADITIDSLYVGGWPAIYDSDAGGASAERPGIDEFGDLVVWTAYKLSVTQPIQIGHRGGHGRFELANGHVDVSERIVLGAGGEGDSLGQWHQRFEGAQVDAPGFDIGVAGSGLVQQIEGVIQCDGGSAPCVTVVGKGEDDPSKNYIPGAGLLHQSGGAFTTDKMVVGDQIGSGGAVSVHYRASADYGELTLGNHGNGSLNVTGGTVLVQNDVVLGANTGAYGELMFTGGSFTANGDMRIGIDDTGAESGGSGQVTIVGAAGTIAVSGNYHQSANSIMHVMMLPLLGAPLSTTEHIKPIEVAGDVTFESGTRISISLDNEWDNVNDTTGAYDELAPGPTETDVYVLMQLTGSGQFTGVANVELISTLVVDGFPEDWSARWTLSSGTHLGVESLMLTYTHPATSAAPPAWPTRRNPDLPFGSPAWIWLALVLTIASIWLGRRVAPAAVRGSGSNRLFRPGLQGSASLLLTLALVLAASSQARADSFGLSIWWQGENSVSGDPYVYRADQQDNWLRLDSAGRISADQTMNDPTSDPCSAWVPPLYLTSFNMPWTQNGMRSPLPVAWIQPNDNIRVERIYIGGWAGQPGFNFDHLVGFGKHPDPVAAYGHAKMTGGFISTAGYMRNAYRGASSRWDVTGGTMQACLSLSMGIYGWPEDAMGVAEVHLREFDSVNEPTLSLSRHLEAGISTTGLLSQTGGRIDCYSANGFACLTGVGLGWKSASGNIENPYVPGQGLWHRTGGIHDVGPDLQTYEGYIAIGRGFGGAGLVKFSGETGYTKAYGLTIAQNGVATVIQSYGAQLMIDTVVMSQSATGASTYSIEGSGKTGIPTTLTVGPGAFYLGDKGGEANFIVIGNEPKIDATGDLRPGPRSMMTFVLDDSNLVSPIEVGGNATFKDGARIRVVVDPTAPPLAAGATLDVIVADGQLIDFSNLSLEAETETTWDLTSVQIGAQWIVRLTRESVPECRDGYDNDGDTKIDHPADPGCLGPNSANESPQCDDGIDNDSDGNTDHPADNGCWGPSSDNEAPQCSDGIDNDGDTAIDYLEDPECNGDPSQDVEYHVGCGLGFELVPLLLGVVAIRLRRGARGAI